MDSQIMFYAKSKITHPILTCTLLECICVKKIVNFDEAMLFAYSVDKREIPRSK